MTTLCQQPDNYFNKMHFFYCANPIICHPIVLVHQQKRTFFAKVKYNQLLYLNILKLIY